MPLPLLFLLALFTLWLLWAAIAHLLIRNPMGFISGGIGFAVNTLYTSLWHRLRVEGREHIPGPRQRSPEGLPLGSHPPLIVVANHTSGLDPLLIQRACPFYIRWLMAGEMRLPAFNWLWVWLEIIFVGADGQRSGASELASLKETFRTVRAGGVIGIFPEGRLERPRGVLHPFQPGVGVIIARSGAKVLPAVITGTPYSDSAWGSFWPMSRSRVRFMPLIDFTGRKPEEIVADLEDRYREWTGWPVVQP
ncbi:MAG: lysophospholipid acyltransferase family protein [Phycisphaerales bacterium]